jgi:hypothetical protein
MAGTAFRAAGTALLIAGCGLLLAAVALGSTRSHQVTLTSNGEVGTATAHCPGDQRATGGGFSASPPIVTMSGYTFMKVFVSRKVGQRAWRASVEEETLSPMSMSLTAYVYCAKHAPRTQSVAHSVPVPTGVSNFTVSDASCVSGKARAGGFSLSTPDFDGGLIASQRHGKRGWRTRIDSDIGVTATTYAYCAPGRAPKARFGNVGSTGNEFSTAASERCPGGRPPLAGGFGQPDAITGFAGSNYRNFVPYESRRSARRWQGAGYHGGNTTSHLVAIAYCS